ncbi:MAG: hypothetical protein U9P72_00210 [Campylobacterota bacterium]|nr:hypothetical protein [Campylobacterota bacterium]
MRYSYINHRRKSAFTEDMQLLLIFFSITLFMLVLTYIFLLFKEYRFVEDKKSLHQKQVDLNISIYNMKKQITLIEKQNILAESVHTKNAVLKDSISNLFDLVPQRITLSEASLLENGLILQGITPNKDVYNFMLQAPLRSIFHRTYSSFYPAQNGWLKFVSTNYIDKEEEEIELDEE